MSEPTWNEEQIRRAWNDWITTAQTGQHIKELDRFITRLKRKPKLRLTLEIEPSLNAEFPYIGYDADFYRENVGSGDRLYTGRLISVEEVDE